VNVCVPLLFKAAVDFYNNEHGTFKMDDPVNTLMTAGFAIIIGCESGDVSMARALR